MGGASYITFLTLGKPYKFNPKSDTKKYEWFCCSIFESNKLKIIYLLLTMGRKSFFIMIPIKIHSGIFIATDRIRAQAKMRLFNDFLANQLVSEFLKS